MSDAKAKAIFLEALERQGREGLPRFLREACGGDPALRARVEELLRAHQDAGRFLEPPAPPLIDTVDAAPAERPGAVVGPYKLLQQIGEGGMGTVYMAEQTRPVRRKVALKVIKPGMDTRQVVARFEAERQALALMDHVNIARVLDGGATEAGLPYFVMELVHGVPITRYCDDNRLTPRQRLELFVPVCAAIQHAHQKGVIHRDIKPSNVLVTIYDGKPVPKVIDFGVAKATQQRLTERTVFTQYGAVVGTLEYMSPEQAETSALGVDTRSDVYSLGVLLYELLTGSTPLSHRRVQEAAYAEVLRLIKEEEPPRPSTRLSASGDALASISANRHMEPARLTRLVRGELDWIVMKTLEKDRNRRYQTANGFARDVQRYLNDEPVQACPPSALYRFRKFVRRNKTPVSVVGLIGCVLFLTLGVGFCIVVNSALQEERDLARGHQERAETAERRAVDAEREINIRVHLARATAIRRSGHVGQRTEALAEVAAALALRPPSDLRRELRNAAIACLALPDLRLERPWPGWPAGSDHVDFDGNLEHYARADKQGAVSVRRVADDAEVARLLPGFGSESWPLLSRDGKFLAVCSGYSLNLWELGGHEPVLVVHLDDAYGIDFSADSRQCAVGRRDGPIRLYGLASGQPPHELPNGRRGAHLAFHPDGRQLAISCDTSVEIRDLGTGNVVHDLKHQAIAYNLAWHPDGKTLAVACADNRIYLWDVAGGKRTLVLEGIRGGGVAIAFNHAGDLLASTGWDGMLRLWDPRTGHQLFATQSGLPGTAPRFDLDDRLLAGDYREGKLGLWEVAAGGQYRTLVRTAAAGKSEYSATAVRSDGRLLAVGTHDGVGLWDLTSGQELAFLASPGSNFVLFEPSGALLTNGSAGLLRWPVQVDPAAPALLRIGPPHKLSVPGPICHVACSHDGRVIAISQFQGGRVLLADRPDQPVRLGRHDDARYVAVSPDGRWVVTGSHTRTAVKIWEARTGQLVEELPLDGSGVGFSPDGKWLAATREGGLGLWAVGSWQEGPRIGGGAFAFSPDGKLLAVDTGYGVVRLVDPDGGREYARLEDPKQDRTFHMSFSPDGSQLVVTSNDSLSVHVWDLRAIRTQLAKMDLDWELPPYPPPAAAAVKPLRVEVDLGDLSAMIQARDSQGQGEGYVRSKQWEKAIAAYSKAIELEPKSAQARNNLAWLLATCPEVQFRDPTRAVELATKACELTPQDGNAWNTLGVAHYGSGAWNAAVAALEKSNDLLGGQGLSFNAFFLAMAHWQLGNKDEARKWYAQAVPWMEKNQPQDEELRRFRAEAAKLLGIEEKKE